MRLRADECMARDVVERLRGDGHDVVWSAESGTGEGDADVLARSVADDRVLISRDHDFGALVFGQRARAVGVVLVSLSSAMPMREVVDLVSRCIEGFGESGLRGRFTTIEARRTRQRALPAPGGRA